MVTARTEKPDLTKGREASKTIDNSGSCEKLKASEKIGGMVSSECDCGFSSDVVGDIECEGLNGVEWLIDTDGWNCTDSVRMADRVGRFDGEFLIEVGRSLVAEKGMVTIRKEKADLAKATEVSKTIDNCEACEKVRALENIGWMVSFECDCDVSRDIVGEIECEGLNGMEWFIDTDRWSCTESVRMADRVGRFDGECLIEVGRFLVAEKAIEFEASGTALEVGVVISERQVGAIAGNGAVIKEHESLTKAPVPVAENERESIKQRLKVTVTPESGWTWKRTEFSQITLSEIMILALARKRPWLIEPSPKH
jgi:hypothetical protein